MSDIDRDKLCRFLEEKIIDAKEKRDISYANGFSYDEIYATGKVTAYQSTLTNLIRGNFKKN